MRIRVVDRQFKLWRVGGRQQRAAALNVLAGVA
jgi:hypothetical protein